MRYVLKQHDPLRNYLYTYSHILPNSAQLVTKEDIKGRKCISNLSIHPNVYRSANCISKNSERMLIKHVSYADRGQSKIRAMLLYCYVFQPAIAIYCTSDILRWERHQ